MGHGGDLQPFGDLAAPFLFAPGHGLLPVSKRQIQPFPFSLLFPAAWVNKSCSAATSSFGGHISLRVLAKEPRDWTLGTGVSSGGRKAPAWCVLVSSMTR